MPWCWSKVIRTPKAAWPYNRPREKFTDSTAWNSLASVNRRLSDPRVSSKRYGDATEPVLLSLLRLTHAFLN